MALQVETKAARVNLNKMDASALARYACLELGLPERQCYQLEGGPLQRRMILRNIKAAKKS